MAANGAEGNQIGRDVMDWWRWEVGNLSPSHMQLSSWAHLAQLSYLDAEPRRTSQLCLEMSLRHARSAHQTPCKIGHRISIWYPRGYPTPKCGGVGELAVNWATARYRSTLSSHLQSSNAVSNYRRPREIDAEQHPARTVTRSKIRSIWEIRGLIPLPLNGTVRLALQKPLFLV